MAIYYQNNLSAITKYKRESVSNEEVLCFLAILTVAAFAAVRFTTYADAGITPTIPVDEKAMKSAESGAYNFDKAHSFIGFKVKHMGLIEVPGYFRDFTGTVNYDTADTGKIVS